MTKADRKQAESLEAIMRATQAAKPKKLVLNDRAKLAKEWADDWKIPIKRAREQIAESVDAGVMRPVNVIRRRLDGRTTTLVAFELAV